jgi:uncharacterized protein
MTTPTASPTPALGSAAPSVRGRFLWHDYMAHDVAAAQRFYGAVLGWGAQPWDGAMPYTMWTADGIPRGGYMAMPDEVRAQGAPPHWLTYVGVKDVDAAVAQAAALGARACFPAEDIPGVGRIAGIFDPQGALIAFYTPATPSDEPVGMAPVGDVSWHELVTSDAPAALDFYAAMFGWERHDDHDMGEFGIYHVFGRNGQMVGGAYTKPEQMGDVPPNWVPYFRVEDIDAVVARVTANGGTILNGPMEVPGGDRVAVAMDAQGGAFGVHEVRSA